MIYCANPVITLMTNMNTAPSESLMLVSKMELILLDVYVMIIISLTILIH